MGELEPRADDVPREETDVVLREVNPIIESFRSDLEANGVDLAKNEALIREMLFLAFEEGTKRLEE